MAAFDGWRRTVWYVCEWLWFLGKGVRLVQANLGGRDEVMMVGAMAYGSWFWCNCFRYPLGALRGPRAGPHRCLVVGCGFLHVRWRLQ